MRRLKATLPDEMELSHGDTTFKVRYDYDRGEEQWFDARAGVGSPGYDPFVEITEVNFGNGWQAPDMYPQFDANACAPEVMAKLADIEADYWEAQADAEYEAWQENKRLWG
jgi:hypothetical protein